MKKNIAVISNVPAITAEVVEQVYTQEDALKSAKRIFNALAEATGNPITAIEVLNAFSEGIESDPETSKSIMTPENISKVFAIKQKLDNGTFRIDDIERAFPDQVKKIPFWGLIKTLKF